MWALLLLALLLGKHNWFVLPRHDYDVIAEEPVAEAPEILAQSKPSNWGARPDIPDAVVKSPSVDKPPAKSEKSEANTDTYSGRRRWFFRRR